MAIWAKDKIERPLKNKLKALSLFCRNRPHLAYIGAVSKVTGVNLFRTALVYLEPIFDLNFHRSMRYNFVNASSLESDLKIGQMATSPLILYSLVRILKPDNLVETGVSSGCSTSFILLALKKNRNGRLISIDFPIYKGDPIPYPEFASYTPDGLGPGWVIPENLKGNWQLVIGKSVEKLPYICKSLKNIDFFFHDSEHSYNNVIFELKTAYNCMSKSAKVMAVDDITMNTAFHDFCYSHKLRYVSISNLGLIKAGGA